MRPAFGEHNNEMAAESVDAMLGAFRPTLGRVPFVGLHRYVHKRTPTQWRGSVRPNAPPQWARRKRRAGGALG